MHLKTHCGNSNIAQTTILGVDESSSQSKRIVPQFRAPFKPVFMLQPPGDSNKPTEPSSKPGQIAPSFQHSSLKAATVDEDESLVLNHSENGADKENNLFSRPKPSFITGNRYVCNTSIFISTSVSDPDPVESVSFGRIRSNPYHLAGSGRIRIIWPDPDPSSRKRIRGSGSASK